MLQQSLRNLDQAFRNWWKGKGRVKVPCFKKRSHAQNIPICGKEFRVTGRGVRFPRIGELRLKWGRDLPAERSGVTVIKDPGGPYFASFMVEVEPTAQQAGGKAIGIDPGLASLAVTSSRERSPRQSSSESALQWIRRLSRDPSRKVKGSSNRTRARLSPAMAHVPVADRRLDHLHKLSTRLIRENQTVCVEDLNGSEIAKNRNLARSIADAGG